MNEALSELYIEDEDHEKLRESVDDYDNFDQVRRAARVCVACCRTWRRWFAVLGVNLMWCATAVGFYTEYVI